VITDAGGIPLAASVTGGTRNDITQLLPLIEATMVYADRAYDHDKYRRLLRAKGISTRIARRGHPHGSGLGTTRWVVERTIAWYHGFRRLRTRWERRDDIHEAFLGVATCIITHRRLIALC
jgi:transposase